MKSVWARLFCRLLVALMIWTPYQFASAGMIGTDQVVTASTQADRDAVLGFVNRGDVARQLQTLGIDPKTAQDRIAALSDQEVQSLAGKIHSVPAGADGGDVAIGILIIAGIAVVVWYLWKRM
ncbi:MAG TPA: PA2779 family protein [Burkholderiales bacterium]|nr:PA2779 family protein [Burkholderiales bacterium]